MKSVQKNLGAPARQQWWQGQHPQLTQDPFTTAPAIQRELATIRTLHVNGTPFTTTPDGAAYHKILNDRLWALQNLNPAPNVSGQYSIPISKSSFRSKPTNFKKTNLRNPDHSLLNNNDSDSNALGAGDWVDKHLLGGAIENWGNVQGLYDSGRATLAQRNLAAARGGAEVVGLATSVVGAGAGVRLIARNIGEKTLVKAIAKESDQQLFKRISGQNDALHNLWGTGGDDAAAAITRVNRAKFYHLPRGADRRALLTYKEIIRRNVQKRLSQNILNQKTLPINDPGLRRTELINLALKKTRFR